MIQTYWLHALQNLQTLLYQTLLWPCLTSAQLLARKRFKTSAADGESAKEEGSLALLVEVFDQRCSNKIHSHSHTQYTDGSNLWASERRGWWWWEMVKDSGPLSQSFGVELKHPNDHSEQHTRDTEIKDWNFLTSSAKPLNTTLSRST